MQAQMTKTFDKKERNMFLTGMFGQNMIYNVISAGLYYYFQNVICLPAMALGWIFMIARVWDAINDPMMGSIVDRTKSKWGKCRPYLIFSPIVICFITIAAFFNNNYATASEKGRGFIVAWAAVSYILWGMCYTAGDVPLWGVIARMTENEKDRSTLLSVSRIVASVAAGLISTTAIVGSQAINKALSKGENDRPGFIIFAVVTTVIATALFMCAGLGVTERVPNTQEKKSMGESFKIAWKCVPFRKLMISGILRSPWQLMNVVIMTLFSYYYCNGAIFNIFGNFKMLLQVGLVAGGMFVGQFACQALCPKLLERFDVKKLYNLFLGISVIPFLLLYITYKIAPTSLNTIPWAAVDGLLLLVVGGTTGALYVFQSVMISDCIDYEEYHTGYRPDGIFFAGQSFMVKFSSGIASIISGVVYSYVGYSDTNIAAMNKALENGASFVNDYQEYAGAMWFLFTIPAAIGQLIAILPTLKYPISKESHNKILAELSERHERENG